MQNQEKEPAKKDQFPWELQGNLMFATALFVELWSDRNCLFSTRPDTEVYDYLKENIKPKVNALDATLQYFEEPSGTHRFIVFCVSGVTEKNEVAIRKILIEEGITWPVRKYKNSDHDYRMNIVQCNHRGVPLLDRPKKKALLLSNQLVSA